MDWRAIGQRRETAILLVEDDEVDVLGFRRALRSLRIANPVTVARDGIEALQILRGERGPYPRPHLIVLDLNLPRMNGIELLRELRADPKLCDSVVFVLTTSRAEQDRVDAYRLNVAGYMVKSDPGASFLAAVTMLDHYWRVVELP